jgi:hypothetical protein
MKARFTSLVLAVGVAIAGSPVSGAGGQQTSGGTDHIDWVAGALTRMQTIKPGMTRKELLVVFTTEGGLSTPLKRTFVSRDCPYFKVDVELKAIGRPARDAAGRVTMVEGDRDRIVKISRPYLQFSIMD